MAIYLAMKNNLKRTFIRRNTYLIVLLLPILIFLFGTFADSISNKEVRIGVLGGEESVRSWEAFFSQEKSIKVVPAKEESIHTDKITGKYDKVITDEKSKEQVVKEIGYNKISRKEAEKGAMSHTERMIAMLVTVYIVIATIYSSKEIKDENEGTKTRFAYAGSGKYSYMLAYVGSTFIIVLLQVEFVLGCLYLLDRECFLSFGRLLLTGGAISFVTSCLASGIVRITRKELSANVTASAFAAFSSVLGGTFVAVTQMPYILRLISVISPIRWILSLL